MQLLRVLLAIAVVWSLTLTLTGNPFAGQGTGLQECVEKGNKLREQERYQEALKTWDECLLLDPGNSMLNSLLMITKGQMIQEEDRYTRIGTKFYYSEPGKALQAWRKVVNINPLNEEARENARILEEEIDALLAKPLAEAETRLNNKEFLHAQEYVVDALRLDPRHPRALQMMQDIRIAYVAGLKDRADRAVQFYRAGNYDRAIRMLEDLIADKAYPPEDLSKTYIYLGLSYASLGSERNAVESFSSALRFNQSATLPDDTDEEIRVLFHKAKNGG